MPLSRAIRSRLALYFSMLLAALTLSTTACSGADEAASEEEEQQDEAAFEPLPALDEEGAEGIAATESEPASERELEADEQTAYVSITNRF